ncbi:MAG: RNA polymerase sigma factor [bacterium]|nr:RNA polymerase sigma factor [bacterium]
MEKEDKIKENILILKCKAGDFKAFEELVRNYQSRIFNFIYRIIFERETAEDLTQETFLRAYKNITSIDVNLSFKNWLYKVAVNLTNDYLREKYLRFQFENFNDITSPEFELSDGDSAARGINRVILLEEGLKKIDPKYRIALLLYFKEGFSYRDIAQKLDLPLNTVRTHLRRAKMELKKVLKI